jgi:hypothetical protein
MDKNLPFTPDKPKAPVAKAGKYGQGYSSAKHLAKQGLASIIARIKKEQKTDVEQQPGLQEELHPDALHVSQVKKNGKPAYKVHKVGKNFADGIKVGEHLSDTELDDACEMGCKVKHIKEGSDLLRKILDEARGRPRKTPAPAAKKSEDDEDDEEDKGPDRPESPHLQSEPDKHISVQLKVASDMKDEKGGAHVKFANGKTHFVPHDVAHKVLTASEKLKPADRAKVHDHIAQSHQNLMSVHKVL